MFISLITGSCNSLGKISEYWRTIFDLQVANLDVGVLYLMGMVSIGVYGIMIGGWASNNKFALIGAIRASSQMISYELAMGLSLLAIIMMNSSLDLKVIAESQSGWYGMKWNIFFQPLAFIIFL